MIHLLHLKGYIVKKIYNGGVPAFFRAGKMRYRTKSEEYRGVPDLMAFNIKKSKFFFIEVKAKKNKASPEQQEFINAVNSCTHFEALVAWDIDQLKAKL